MTVVKKIGLYAPDAGLMALWAKLHRQEAVGGEYHPLLYHLMDVAACAEAFWDLVLMDRARENISGRLGLKPDAARAWIAFIAGLHDLGKASPAFFKMDPRGEQRLRRAGVTLRCQGPTAPHGLISAAALRAVLPEFGVDGGSARNIAMLVGGHHGVIPGSEAVRQVPPGAIGDGVWGELRRALAHHLAVAIGLPEDAAPHMGDNAAAFWLAGLVSVADWIGSNQRFFSFAASQIDEAPPYDPEYLSRGRDNARKALRDLGWLAQPGVPEAAPFEALFRYSPNSMQRAVMSLGHRLNSPGMVIVEAPMGQGKTEAALWLADEWRRRLGQRGMYVALPTQATSDQMFGRVLTFLEKRYPRETVNAQLLHGHASLSAEFAELRRRGDRLWEPGEVGEAEAEAVAAAEWFTHRKRGVLAPFGVGTVDQALFAALQVKHVFVRLFGLAHKTVIVDEVHAYDLYMSTVLDRLLEWLAALGSTVVLLSATLPDARRKEVAAAYARGLGTGPLDVGEAQYPRLTWVDGIAGKTIPIAQEEQPRTVKIEWVDGRLREEGEPFPLGDLLQNVLARGGTAAVICNTVRRAQDVYRALQPHFKGMAEDGEPLLDLLHARFPMEEREAREARTLVRFGKRGEVVRRGEQVRIVSRPHRAVLVATQIVEQSLDLDFDVMVTDLAPTDLVLQRSGRLWRHGDRDGERPIVSREPVLYICRPALDASGVPHVDPGAERVYSAHALLRSWLVLQDRPQVAIPGDVSALIEETYGPFDTSSLSAPLRVRWEETLGQQRKGQQREEAEAGWRVIRDPRWRRLWEIQGEGREEDRPEIHRDRQMLTRLTEPSVTVALLENRDGALCLPDGTKIQRSERPSEAIAQRILRRTVSIADRRVLEALIEATVPSGWQRHPLLRAVRPVELSPDGRKDIQGHSLVLDPLCGVYID